jgi:hypothetical protein
VGFGAKYNGEVYNVFQCGTKRLVKGIDGILQAYRDQFRSGITMARTPTVFTDVIRTARAHADCAARAAEKLQQQAYTILCILTDGDVEFVEETVAAILTTPALRPCPLFLWELAKMSLRACDSSTTIAKSGRGERYCTVRRIQRTF